MPFNTELTRRLGIRVPVIQGGLMHVGTADLASAVSNAGGLGIITALISPTPDALRAEIRRCRSLTDKPFGVNLTLLPSLLPPDYPAYAQAIIDEGVKIVETAGNSPGPVIRQLKQAGVTVLHKCTTIRHAQSAVKLGVDFLSIDGFECAGHVGESDITNFILLGRARQTLKTPFIASGGFADGQGLAAALVLGACGINMGTRFVCTEEAPVHRNIKEAIVRGQETDTALLLRRWTNTTRLYKNKVAEEALKVERESKTGEFSEVAPFVSGKRGKEVFINGDPEHGVWTTGQVMGLIHDIPTCAELVARIEKEAEATLREKLSMIVSDSKL
ncbi:inosine monophosphate dehydrogenase [Trichoderma citrinoviride]|uniref:Inosine monophosphate dehydrogenase n=1 Tax=Trichoderma citrinoviride TaxID=58853 RepID=A0A2T4BI41_9HYPO|nr:inosine monophosphate dehydrogenase [Trichoderma citrinoviride]PTB68987.1 inosine monophosphate dehydrogenase [Trichoderma citrinoviride]